MELGPNARRLVWAAFVAYLLLFGYTLTTGDPTASFVLDLAFIGIMLLFAAFAYRQFGAEPLGLVTAAALAGAAVTEAVALFAAVATASAVADVLLIAGLVLYIYLRQRG